MATREHFEQQLRQLASGIMAMLDLVEEQLNLALQAYRRLDPVLGQKVIELDKHVDRTRYAIEEQCLTLIALQQPAAGDLRLVFTAMNVIVDIERMGNQAKGIAQALKRINYNIEDSDRILQVEEMGKLVQEMLFQAKEAYTARSIELAQQVIDSDAAVDKLYARIFILLTYRTAEVSTTEAAQVEYELLRIARELERFGDLVTHVAERVVYLVTGRIAIATAA